jgi:hypothetical protein
VGIEPTGNALPSLLKQAVLARMLTPSVIGVAPHTAKIHTLRGDTSLRGVPLNFFSRRSLTGQERTSSPSNGVPNAVVHRRLLHGSGKGKAITGQFEEALLRRSNPIWNRRSLNDVHNRFGAVSYFESTPA